jgi:hypothetical protein
MTEGELIRRIINNIKDRHEGNFEEAMKRIFDQELELDSTYVFFWDDTPEGGDFWEEVYWDLRNRHIALKDLLTKPFAIEIDDPFISIEFFI